MQMIAIKNNVLPINAINIPQGETATDLPLLKSHQLAPANYPHLIELVDKGCMLVECPFVMREGGEIFYAHLINPFPNSGHLWLSLENKNTHIIKPVTKDYISVVNRFKSCKSIRQLWHELSYWNDNASVARFSQEYKQHSVFSTPMTLSEMKQRIIELNLTNKDDEDLDEEEFALTYRMSITKPQTRQDIGILAKQLQRHLLSDLDHKDFDLYTREIFNFIDGILHYAEQSASQAS